MASSRSTDSDSLVVIVIIALLVAVGLGDKFGFLGLGDEPTAPRTTNPSVVEAVLSGAPKLTAKSAREQLSMSIVSTPKPMTGYSRARFPHWKNAADNGWSGVDAACDAREAALIRDGVNVETGKGCAITSGTWIDPYTGAPLATASDVDIDHVVPIAAAWASGASLWTDAQRQAYANDPEVLLASGASSNRSKGDRSPDLWAPPEPAAQCGYAMRWIDIKTRYVLTFTPAEKSKLGQMLDTCKAT